MLKQILWTACVTPFTVSGDAIDYKSLEKLLDIQAESGNGIVLLGSTGEGLSFTDAERRQLVTFVCTLKIKAPVLVGVPSSNLYQALEWMEFCRDFPIDGYLMTTPIYTKPGVMGQTLWFETLMNKAHKPAMLYNIPSRAGISLHTETVQNLSQHERFAAIKDSSGTVDSLVAYKMVAPEIAVFCGDDYMMPSMAAEGAAGLVSIASNAWPVATRWYVVQALKSEYNTHSKVWWQASKAILAASNPIPIKALLHDLKLIEHDTVRLPLSIQDLPSRENLRQIHQLIAGV